MRPLFAVVVAAGCRDSLVCTLQPRPAVIAEIRDSISNVPAAYGSSLVVQGRAVYDSSSSYYGVTDSTRYSALTSRANGSPGTYDVRVRRPGYRLWQQSSVLVAGDRCGADAVKLTVRLQPGG